MLSFCTPEKARGRTHAAGLVILSITGGAFIANNRGKQGRACRVKYGKIRQFIARNGNKISRNKAFSLALLAILSAIKRGRH
jgi:hypothetical protein